MKKWDSKEKVMVNQNDDDNRDEELEEEMDEDGEDEKKKEGIDQEETELDVNNNGGHNWR